MIPFEEALKIALKNTVIIGKEQVSLTNSLNRILAEEVTADRDMPPFNKSAVDGYACNDPNDGENLKVIETIPAGKTSQYRIEPGKCLKIMTGAEVPEGANWVVMVENTEEIDEDHIRVVEKGRKSNIAKRAEDLRQGERVLEPGTYLKSQHIGILASFGKAEPLVFKQPVVNIITTGNELVEPHETPAQGEIRNSNGMQLFAQFRSVGIDPHYEGIVTDTKDNVLEVLEKSVTNYSITVLTGGVSMGDYDFVPDMMEKAGVEILFHKIAIKPGKPTILGRKGDHLVVGLPGNPVSTFLQFEILLKPILYKMMGAEYKNPKIKLPLAEEIRTKKSDRESWKPIQIIDGQIYPLDYHGSGHLHALHKTDGFICILADTQKIEKGTILDVRQI